MPLSHSITTQSLPPLSRMVMFVALTVVKWEDRRRTRKGLSRLDAHLLRDVGLDPATACSEMVKPFWRD